MWIKRLVFSFVGLLIATAPLSLHGSNEADSYAGGAFSIDNSINVSSALLSPSGASLSFNCPITSTSGGGYSVNWVCAGGSVSITSADKSLTMRGSFIQGSMTLTASGGGRGGHTTYSYSFYGSLNGTVTTGKVTQFAYGAVSQYVTSGSQLGSGSAPVNGGSFGWNSGFSPLLIADASNSRLIVADNIKLANQTTYGSAGNGVGQFGTISGLAEDTTQHIYIADSSLDRLARIDDLTGLHWVTLGSAGTGAGHFSNPHGVTIDSTGHIWVADTNNNCIVRFDDMTGKNWTSFGSAGAGVDQFNAPQAVAFDHEGRIYIADTGNSRLVRVDDLTGKNWVTVTEQVIDPYGYSMTATGVAIDATDQIIVPTTDGYLLRVPDMTGIGGQVSYWGGALNFISLDQSDTLYLTGAFTPGLAQAESALGDGYFAPGFGSNTIVPTALLALSTPVPTPASPVLSTAALDFGSENVGEATKPQMLTLLNLGATAMPIQSLNAASDYVVTDKCPASLSGGGSCSLNLVFKPTTTGERAAQLALATVSAHALAKVSLAGVGTEPQPVVVPPALSFDPQKLATSSGTQMVTLNNSGTGPLSIASISASAGFTESSNCPTVVPPGTGCTLQVAFQPSAAGIQSGSLTLTDDAVPGGTEQVIALTGTGSATAPAFVLTPESVQFPDQELGTTSAKQTVMLTNNSGLKVALTAPTFAEGFTGSSTCGSSLNNRASCDYSIEFKPEAAGPITGSLMIPITGQPTFSVGLSGTAVRAASAAVLAPSPASLGFGQQVVGDSGTLSTVLSNPSRLAVGIASVHYSGSSAFTITGNDCPAVLSSKANCTVQITFLPGAVYENTGTLTVVESSGAQTGIAVTGESVSDGGGGL